MEVRGANLFRNSEKGSTGNQNWGVTKHTSAPTSVVLKISFSRSFSFFNAPHTLMVRFSPPWNRFLWL